MRSLIRKVAICGGLALLACSVSTQAAEGQRIDEVPMYGGMDRSKVPELKAADEKFIAEVSAAFGTREKASTIWVNQGFRFYGQDQFGMAMRRFNQAWLLNPKNPEVFAGFSAVLHDQSKNCEAMKMMEQALALNPPTFQGIYPDAARIVTLCAVQDTAITKEARQAFFTRSEALYKKADELEPNKAYVYGSWATAYYWRGQYPEAWAMVAKARALGNKLNDKFLNLLKEKMPEPNRQ